MSRSSLALACLALSPLAQAATFVVDTTSDAVLDLCAVDTLADCSLRGAITAANAIAGPHQINFDLPQSDPGYVAATQHWRIAPATDLPGITSDLTIDGYSQAGASPNANPMHFGSFTTQLKIELRGPNFNSTTGLLGGLSGSSLFVRGLAINGFTTGVYLFEPGTHRFEGNFIGTDISGQQAVPNQYGIAPAGVTIIGGSSQTFANLISGNEFGGIVSFRELAELQVQGNFIGPAADGQTALPSQEYGIQLTGQFRNVMIGGNSPSASNIISGNNYSAIYLSGEGAAGPGMPHARIQGNYIGTDQSGTQRLGNGFIGGIAQPIASAIQIFRADDCGVVVGGGGANEGNLIAYNGAAGVHVGLCRNAPVLGNNFHGNLGLAIDLTPNSGVNGSTPNDAGDIDEGGNRLQNTVELLSMVEDAASDQLRLSVRVDSAPSAATYPLRIDIYRNDAFGSYPVASELYLESEAQQPHDFVLPLSLVGSNVAFGVTDANGMGNSSELLYVGALFRDSFEGTPPGGG